MSKPKSSPKSGEEKKDAPAKTPSVVVHNADKFSVPEKSFWKHPIGWLTMIAISIAIIVTTLEIVVARRERVKAQEHQNAESLVRLNTWAPAYNFKVDEIDYVTLTCATQVISDNEVILRDRLRYASLTLGPAGRGSVTITLNKATLTGTWRDVRENGSSEHGTLRLFPSQNGNYTAEVYRENGSYKANAFITAVW